MILSNEEVVLSKFFRPLTVAKISNWIDNSKYFSRKKKRIIYSNTNRRVNQQVQYYKRCL